MLATCETVLGARNCVGIGTSFVKRVQWCAEQTGVVLETPPPSVGAVAAAALAPAPAAPSRAAAAPARGSAAPARAAVDPARAAASPAHATASPAPGTPKVTLKRPPGAQRSIPGFGFSKTAKLACGSEVTLQGEDGMLACAPAVSPKVYDCRYCASSFTHAPARAIHEKKHDQAHCRVISRDPFAASAAEVERKRRRTNPRPSEIAEDIAKAQPEGEAAPVDAPTQKHRGGSKRRLAYTFEWKAEILRLAEEAERNGGLMVDVAKNAQITEGMLSCWRRDRVAILKCAGNDLRKRLSSMGTVNRKEGKCGLFPKAEANLHAMFLARRRRGRRVTERWLCYNARQLVLAEYGDDPNLSEAAGRFKASHHWRHRWSKRWNVVPRKRSNKKLTPLAERVPKWQKYHRFLKRFVSSDKWQLKDAIWGGFKPEQRYSVDQVPLPFVVGADKTFKTKGVNAVSVKQPGDGLEKRQATLQLCFRPVVLAAVDLDRLPHKTVGSHKLRMKRLGPLNAGHAVQVCALHVPSCLARIFRMTDTAISRPLASPRPYLPRYRAAHHGCGEERVPHRSRRVLAAEGVGRSPVLRAVG